MPAETIHRMVVHHPNRLHEGIANRGANKSKALCFQSFAHCLGFRGLGGVICQGLEVMNDWDSTYKGPEVFTEAPMLLLYFQVCPGILDKGANLGAVANNAGVLK